MLLFSSLTILLSTAVTLRRDKSIAYSRTTLLLLFCSFTLCFFTLFIHFIDKGIALFGGMYHVTSISVNFYIFFYLLTFFILQLNSFYPRKINVEEKFSAFKLLYCKLFYNNTFILNKMATQFKILEYPLILLFIIMGAIFLMSSSDLVSLFLSIELQSYGLYILCTVYRNSESATSGGLMYFLLGGLSSCFILLASGLLYGNSGNTGFDGFYIVNNISNFNDLTFLQDFEWYKSNYLIISLVILSVGFLFKISAAPFHFWSPDVYDAIPTVVTTSVAILAKISILILLLELVHFTTNIFFTNNFSWTVVFVISALLSLLIGSILGLTQFRIKRLYAYSTISHLGFILLALAINTRESVQSFIFYLTQYSISNLNAFILLVVIGYSLYFYTEKNNENIELLIEDSSNYVKNLENEVNSIRSYDQTSIFNEDNSNISKHYTKNLNEKHNTLFDKKYQISYADNKETNLLDKNNSPVQLINQLKGYFYLNPLISLSLAITLFSFVGVPPLVGFFAKQMILTSAINNGYIFLAFIAILTSVISAYYYLALIKQMFFFESDYEINPYLLEMKVRIDIIENKKIKEKTTIDLNSIKLSSSLAMIISLLTFAILLFIFSPQHWLSVANILAIILFDT